MFYNPVIYQVARAGAQAHPTPDGTANMDYPLHKFGRQPFEVSQVMLGPILSLQLQHGPLQAVALPQKQRFG